MKNIIFFIFIISVIYITFINFVSYTSDTKLIQDTFQDNQIQKGSEQKIGMGMNVEVTVKRNRFYCKIIETNQNSKLYVLSLIPIPLISNGFSFKFIHLIFTIFISLLFIFLTILYYSNKNVRRQKHALDTQNITNNLNFDGSNYSSY